MLTVLARGRESTFIKTLSSTIDDTGNLQRICWSIKSPLLHLRQTERPFDRVARRPSIGFLRRKNPSEFLTRTNTYPRVEVSVFSFHFHPLCRGPRVLLFHCIRVFACSPAPQFVLRVLRKHVNNADNAKLKRVIAIISVENEPSLSFSSSSSSRGRLFLSCSREERGKLNSVVHLRNYSVYNGTVDVGELLVIWIWREGWKYILSVGSPTSSLRLSRDIILLVFDGFTLELFVTDTLLELTVTHFGPFQIFFRIYNKIKLK